MDKQSLKEFSFTIIICASCFLTLFSTAIIPTSTYIGYGVCLLLLFLFFIQLRIYRYTLGITLIAGTINLVSFTASTMVLGLGVSSKALSSSIGIGLQPLSFLLLLGFVALYKTELAAMFSNSPQNKATTASVSSEIDIFKQRFSNKSTEELERIAADNERKPEAVEAAKLLLEER
jgi:signal transduction histidine kinase